MALVWVWGLDNDGERGCENGSDSEIGAKTSAIVA